MLEQLYSILMHFLFQTFKVTAVSTQKHKFFIQHI